MSCASSEQLMQKSSADSQLHGCDHVDDGGVSSAGAACGNKSVWNLPSSNGYADVGVVIDAEHWPALSDSARASPKSSSESRTGLSDLSVFSNLVSLSPSSEVSPSSPNPNLGSSPSLPARHKPMKRANLSGSANGGFSASPSLAVSLQMTPPESEKQSASEISPKDLTNHKHSRNSDNWDGSSKVVPVFPQKQGGNVQRGHGGSRKGSNDHDNACRSRRHQEWGGFEWHHRSFLRDVHMLHLYPARPYLRPMNVAQLISPPPPPRLGSNNLGFAGVSSAVYYVPSPPHHHPESLRGVPFTPHPPHTVPSPPFVFYPASDPQRSMLIKQIDYYFSPGNLCKDMFLRQNMDDQGWVSISLIAGFNRVKQLTNNIQYMLDTMRLSKIVEVQGDKIRKRNGWKTWVLNSSHLLGSTESRRCPTSAIYDGLAAKLNSFGLKNSSNSISMEGSAPILNQPVE